MDSQFKTSSVLWITGLLLLGAVISFQLLDPYCAKFFEHDYIPGDAKAFFQYIGAFGHGAGCLVAVALIWTLDPTRRSGIKLVLGSTILAGVIATLMKVAFHRARPFYESVQPMDPDFAEKVFNNAMQSFPSGHSATAFSLAFALSMLYPKGSKLFFTFAVITGFQRVMVTAHFPSDVCVGAAIGIVSAFAIFRLRHWQLNSASVLRSEYGTP